MRQHARPRFARRDTVSRVELAEHAFRLLFAERVESMRDVPAAAYLDDAPQDRIVTRFDDDIGAIFEDTTCQNSRTWPGEDAFLKPTIRVTDLIQSSADRVRYRVDSQRNSDRARRDRSFVEPQTRSRPRRYRRCAHERPGCRVRARVRVRLRNRSSSYSDVCTNM